jgi:hypothetical protein
LIAAVGVAQSGGGRRGSDASRKPQLSQKLQAGLRLVNHGTTSARF